MKYFCQVIVPILMNFLLLVNSKQNQPNIIFIYADDLGWGDVSFHGSPEIPTPNIDALAISGILLNNYYGQWLCTPSRAALLTGKHPIRLGLQHFVIFPGEASGLPLEEVTLPQYLKKLGYSTHIIGKWHLGYMTKQYFPTSRGFDTFYGTVNGVTDFYDYTLYERTRLKNPTHFYGIDLYNGTNLIRDFRGTYATEHFTDKAKELINQHNTSKPFFLYLSHVAVHGNSLFKPATAPQKYMKRVMHIPDLNRRYHAATTVALDDSVGEVIKTLSDKGMLKNSIVVFASDNGGDSVGVYGGSASNFPLRSTKYTMWEGGSRVPALIWSPYFKLQEPRIYTDMMSVMDWLPTLYRAAGGNPSEISGIDGKDMWDALKSNSKSPRKEMLYNIDPITEVAALRVGNMKIINGSNSYNNWNNPQTYNCYNTKPMSKDCAFAEKSLVRHTLIESCMWNTFDTKLWRKKASIACNQVQAQLNGDECKKTPCLYNLEHDPCEHHNIADKNPALVDDLMKRIHDYHKIAVKPQFKPSDPRANPECHDFAYVPWMEPEHFNECKEYS